MSTWKDETFQCPITHECMNNPVFAADGHSYERYAIECWLAKKQTSPVTNQRLSITTLTPNHQLKSQIDEWREAQKSDANKQTRLQAHFLRISWASSKGAACQEIELLSAAVEREAMVVQDVQVRKARKCLEEDDAVWCDEVKTALDVLEAQCQAVVSGKVAHLRAARAAVRCAEKTAGVMEGNVEQLRGELRRAEQLREEVKGKLGAAQKALGDLRRVATLYRVEAVGLEAALGGCDEEGAQPGGGRKRKRTSDSAGVDADQRRLHGRSLFEEANKLLDVDNARGCVLTQIAGEFGFHCARAMCLLNGWGVEQDMEAGVKLLQTIADEERYVQCALGACYRYGHGVSLNMSTAVEWYTKAAEQGHGLAQRFLGALYETGECVSQDMSKAMELYIEAAEQGIVWAQNSVGTFYYVGNDAVVRDASKAAEWFSKAALQGYASAQHNLGVCYENGQGVARDRRKAVEWYTKAAEQGCAPAQNNLGVCYEIGQGVVENISKAMELYTKAAEQGNASAQNSLSLLRDRSKCCCSRYEYGRGVVHQGCRAGESIGTV